MLAHNNMHELRDYKDCIRYPVERIRFFDGGSVKILALPFGDAPLRDPEYERDVHIWYDGDNEKVFIIS